jgi:hypothetical protein
VLSSAKHNELPLTVYKANTLLENGKDNPPLQDGKDNRNKVPGRRWPAVSHHGRCRILGQSIIFRPSMAIPIQTGCFTCFKTRVLRVIDSCHHDNSRISTNIPVSPSQIRREFEDVLKMSRQTRQSPSSTAKTGSSEDTRESTPGMATTPATSVASSSPKLNGAKLDNVDTNPTEGLVTSEMMKEESKLHESSEQKELAETSSQVTVRGDG